MIKVENDEIRIKGGLVEVFEDYGRLTEAMAVFFEELMPEDKARKLIATVVYVATSNDMDDDEVHNLAKQTGDILAEALRRREVSDDDKDVLDEIKEMLKE